MASLPGAEGEVYFGEDVDSPLPDWRKDAAEGDYEDDDSEQPTPEELRRAASLLGFDPSKYALSDESAEVPGESSLESAEPAG